MPGALESALARHRAVSIVALVVLTLAAWAWLLAGAGMAMRPPVSLDPNMTGGADASGMTMANMAMSSPSPWSMGHIALFFSMWWVMMVGMMLPSAAPMILLYARAGMSGDTRFRPATGSFLTGYLVAWAAFSLVAALLQIILELVGLLVPITMASQSRWLSGAILISAGMYQLSPAKDVCLRQCQSPARFLSLHFRPGSIGALRMGLLHGAFCVGCCWLLMALLFVGGVMNLAWIALLTLMVAAEKLLPFGRYASLATGLACIAWGMVMLIG